MLAIIKKISKACITGFLFLAFVLAAKAQSGPPYSVIWVNPSGVTVNGGILTRTSSGGSWGGAISSNLLASGTDG